MNGREEGFLLLTSHLGNPERKVLTVAQFRLLAQCVRGSEYDDPTGELTQQELMNLGLDGRYAQRILELLSHREQLRCYLQEGTQLGCYPVTRVSPGYPGSVHKRLGLDAPGCLWCKGDQNLLHTPAVSLVGSRDLREENYRFAQEVGKQAAMQGITLVSGNARGADRAAQDACLSHGGSVICVVADSLCRQPAKERVLYISEDSFDAPFTSPRAHSRNRVIHALGLAVFVAQSSEEKGGTWHGTMYNLQNCLSPVAVFCDGSEASERLIQHGAMPISTEQLGDIPSLFSQTQNLFDR